MDKAERARQNVNNHLKEMLIRDIKDTKVLIEKIKIEISLLKDPKEIKGLKLMIKKAEISMVNAKYELDLHQEEEKSDAWFLNV